MSGDCLRAGLVVLLDFNLPYQLPGTSRDRSTNLEEALKLLFPSNKRNRPCSHPLSLPSSLPSPYHCFFISLRTSGQTPLTSAGAPLKAGTRHLPTPKLRPSNRISRTILPSTYIIDYRSLPFPLPCAIHIPGWESVTCPPLPPLPSL